MGGETGETDLDKLIASMSPQLLPGTFVWCTTTDTKVVSRLLLSGDLVSYCQEDEGYTMVVKEGVADLEKLKHEFRSRCITLQVHSALEAVGLTACFAAELGKHGISANVVAGFYHDHIFVAETDGDRARKVLQELSLRKRARL